MSQFRKDTQLTLLSRIPVMLLSFISVIFLTRLLGAEGNGIYTFTMASIHLFLIFLGFQLEGTLMVFLAKEKTNTVNIFSAVAFLALVSFLAFMIIFSILVFFVPGGTKWVLPPRDPNLFFYIFIALLFITRKIAILTQATLRGIFKFKLFNTYIILIQLISVITYGTMLVITLMNNNPIALINCFKVILAVELSIAILGIFLLYYAGALRFSSGFRPFLKPLTTYSLKNYMGFTGQFLNKRLDVWFVQFFQGTNMLGQYGLATQMTNFINEAMNPLNQVMIPYIVDVPLDQHQAIVARTARINISIATLAAFLICGTSWLFIPILFGKAFEASVIATQILAVGIIFISQRMVFSGYFRAVGKLVYPIRAEWTGVAITIVLDILLIPKYGIAGASVATIIAYGITSLYLIYAAKKHLLFSWKDILLLQKNDIRWLLSKSSSSH